MEKNMSKAMRAMAESTGVKPRIKGSNAKQRNWLDDIEEFGRQVGKADLAKLDAMLCFQNAVRNNLATADDAKEAARRYDIGMADTLGRKPLSSDSLDAVTSQFRGFADPRVLASVTDGYKSVLAFGKGKTKAELAGGSRTDLAIACNAEVRRTKEGQTPPAINAALAQKLCAAKIANAEESKRKRKNPTETEKRDVYLPALKKAADALAHVKVGISPKLRKALKELLAVIPETV